MNTVWHSLCRVIRMRLEDKKNTACYHWPRPVSVVIQLPSTRMVFLSSSTVVVRLVLSVSLCVYHSFLSLAGELLTYHHV